MRPTARRARRRPALGTALALALVVLAGCGSVEPEARSAAENSSKPEETMATDQPTPGAAAGIECGATFTRAPGGALRMTGHFPAAVPAGVPTLTGSVEVAAVGDRAVGVVTPLADVFLVRDGQVVTVPLAQDSVGRELDLADGRPESLPATASLVPCSGDGGLAPGSYDLYVRVVLNHPDGSSTDSLGGPWPLEVG